MGMEPEGFVPRDIAGYFAADREKERRERVQAVRHAGTPQGDCLRRCMR